MTDAKRAEYVTREKILNLLSDEETAKVSKKETATTLIPGDDYLDLENLEQGIRQAKSTVNVSAKNILPRSAVSAATWSKINTALAG